MRDPEREIPSYPLRILVTGARAPHALALVRLLAAAGHEVYTAETSQYHICRYSNAIRDNFEVPSPRTDPEGFVNTIIALSKLQEIDLLIPMWEETLYLSQALDLFPDTCHVFCTNFDTLHTLHHKSTFHKKLESYQIDTPKAQLITSPQDLENLDFDTPFALKPCYSRAGVNVTQCFPGEPLPEISFNPSNPWLAQEWIEGKKYCTYSVCYEGMVNAHSTYPVQYAIDGKSCLNFEPIQHAGIEEWIKDFIKRENFTGQIGFDFIESEEGVLYPIECNPRSTSGLFLFNHEDHLDHAFTEKLDTTIYPSGHSQKQIMAGMIIYGWRDQALLSYLKTLVSYQDIVFDKGDLKPFLTQPILYSWYIWQSKQHQLSLPAVFTYDLDWNGKVDHPSK